MAVAKETVKIFPHLKKELDFDFCLRCGTCIASCPVSVLELEGGGPALKGRCVRCGLCYEKCPQFVDDLELAEQVFGEKPEPDGIGVYQEAYSVQTNSSEIQLKCQDGGAVTSLLTALLEDGFIDGAIVMGVGSEPWRPVPKVAVTPEDTIECAGTKYSPGPILTGLRDAADLYYLERLAFVGAPCQVKAFRWMRIGERIPRRISSRVKLAVGLFCMENFPYRNIKEIVKNKFDLDISEVAKFDIDKGKFIVYPKKGSKKEVDVKSLDQFVFTPCKVCSDFTSELADISVGSIGSPSGYSTVILRTPMGAEAFNAGTEAKAFETEPLEDVKPGMKLVEKVSSSKKKKAKKEIKRRKGSNESLPPRLMERVD